MLWHLDCKRFRRLILFLLACRPYLASRMGRFLLLLSDPHLPSPSFEKSLLYLPAPSTSLGALLESRFCLAPACISSYVVLEWVERPRLESGAGLTPNTCLRLESTLRWLGAFLDFRRSSLWMSVDVSTARCDINSHVTFEAYRLSSHQHISQERRATICSFLKWVF
jgi:hypothetical protein